MDRGVNHTYIIMVSNSAIFRLADPEFSKTYMNQNLVFSVPTQQHGVTTLFIDEKSETHIRLLSENFVCDHLYPHYAHRRQAMSNIYLENIVEYIQGGNEGQAWKVMNR